MSASSPSKQFWDAYAGLVLVATDGALTFTAAGRAALWPQLARAGLDPSRIRTCEAFKPAMRQALARTLEDNTHELLAVLKNPQASDEDREAVRRVLAADPQARHLLPRATTPLRAVSGRRGT